MAVVAGAVAAFAALASGGSASPRPERAGDLRALNAALAVQSRSALLELYGLEERLQQARERAAAVRAELDHLEAQRERVRVRLSVAESSLRAADRLLGIRLRALYENGQTDPLAVLLGAESLDAAVSGLESLRSAAQHDREVLAQVREARRDLRAASRELKARARAVRAAEAEAAATVSALASRQAERRRYLAHLEAERGLNSREISRLEAAAETAQRRTVAVAAPAPASVAPETTTPVVSGTGERTLTVEASGYSLQGTTSTGIPVGWGVVAVDPSVIPLGTRISIPGYGEGVAADTGRAVQGPRIDIWFSTAQQALAWGRRTVTVVLR
jgi:3D (Asp-Asp-Asp) domain-containing protein/septal ring factor EnvC (AmiA/AmiB activator)